MFSKPIPPSIKKRGNRFRHHPLDPINTFTQCISISYFILSANFSYWVTCICFKRRVLTIMYTMFSLFKETLITYPKKKKKNPSQSSNICLIKWHINQRLKSRGTNQIGFTYKNDKFLMVVKHGAMSQSIYDLNHSRLTVLNIRTRVLME